MSPATVTLHALEAGSLTLPERFFVSPLEDQDVCRTVPSLSFLIQHEDKDGTTTRILFDLGIRRDVEAYSSAIRKHASTRQPLITNPDVVESLAAGHLKAANIDLVILSHVHWDHVGMPSDFPNSRFLVGHGSISLLNGTSILQNGSHSHFESDLLPLDRTIKLPVAFQTPPNPPHDDTQNSKFRVKSTVDLASWRPLHILPYTIDLFRDGSLYIVDAPGHLQGHINLLCRTDADRYVYLAGDAYHDSRLLSGEFNIAEWTDPARPNVVCCIHTDRHEAEDTIEKIRSLQSGMIDEFGAVEIIFAHDADWAADARTHGKFFPGTI